MDEWTENLKPSLDEEKSIISKFINNIINKIKYQIENNYMIIKVGKNSKDIEIILDKLNTFKKTYIINDTKYKEKKANELVEKIKN